MVVRWSLAVSLARACASPCSKEGTGAVAGSSTVGTGMACTVTGPVSGTTPRLTFGWYYSVSLGAALDTGLDLSAFLLF